MGHPFDPNKNTNKRELNGYFFNMFTKACILLIWEIDTVSFRFLEGHRSSYILIIYSQKEAYQ